MFNLPAFGPDWIEGFAAIWFALMIGKVTRQETRVLTTCLIGAILTGSWVGVFVASMLPLTLFPLDIIKKVGS